VELPYTDRRAAGRLLADRVAELDLIDPMVLGLPRGGVVVAAPVAERLGVPLDVWCVRKVGVPGQEELALGAVASGGIRVLEDAIVARLGLSPDHIDRLVEPRLAALAEQEQALRGDHPPPQVAGRTVVVVDDGLATGATARAACLALRAADARFVVLAVPVASTTGVRTVTEAADHIVCPAVPMHFWAVGQWYRDFGEITDHEVLALLNPP
jgi:predicted phosphoribosyltransferase